MRDGPPSPRSSAAKTDPADAACPYSVRLLGVSLLLRGESVCVVLIATGMHRCAVTAASSAALALVIVPGRQCRRPRSNGPITDRNDRTLRSLPLGWQAPCGTVGRFVRRHGSNDPAVPPRPPETLGRSRD
jgi:hypothetical protein